MSVKAYNVMGQKASHGCVRLLCKDSKWIYDHCALGTKVIIFRGTKKTHKARTDMLRDGPA